MAAFPEPILSLFPKFIAGAAEIQHELMSRLHFTCLEDRQIDTHECLQKERERERKRERERESERQVYRSTYSLIRVHSLGVLADPVKGEVMCCADFGGARPVPGARCRVPNECAQKSLKA